VDQGNLDVWKTLIAGLGVIITLLVSAWKVRKDLHGRRTQLRDDFRFALEFEKSKSEMTMSPLMEERGYWALIGRTDVPYRVAKHLVSLDEPALALRFYPSAEPRLKFDTESGSFSFKGFYASSAFRMVISVGTWIAFVVLYLIATSPLMLHALKVVTASQAWGLAALTIPVFLSLSIFSLRFGVGVKRAERLMELQATAALPSARHMPAEVTNVATSSSAAKRASTKRLAAEKTVARKTAAEAAPIKARPKKPAIASPRAPHPSPARP